MNEAEAVIVGGGIGGLGAAFALARQGVCVRVLEQAEEFAEVGAGIQIGPNCTRILDNYGLLDQAVGLGLVPDSMVMRDAVDGRDLTRLDLRDVEKRFGHPYLVIHRSDLHGLLLQACRRAGVELVTDAKVVDYAPGRGCASVSLADGAVHTAPLVIAADGLHSGARGTFVGDQPVSSAYVAYRGTVAVGGHTSHDVDLSEVVVYVGPRCHFVRYGLRGGQLLNQVAVFESDRALAGEQNWGTPDELDGAFAQTCDVVRDGLPHLWRNKWWRMYDRDPVSRWVFGRVALLGDAAHPPLQYIAQGAVMALEDGWVLGEHISHNRVDGGGVDWPRVLADYEAVRSEHCRRVLTASRAWGRLWHLDGLPRQQRNVLLRKRCTHDYSFVDWLYGPTALFPHEEPEMFTEIPLSSVSVGGGGLGDLTVGELY